MDLRPTSNSRIAFAPTPASAPASTPAPMTGANPSTTVTRKRLRSAESVEASAPPRPADPSAGELAETLPAEHLAIVRRRASVPPGVPPGAPPSVLPAALAALIQRTRVDREPHTVRGLAPALSAYLHQGGDPVDHLQALATYLLRDTTGDHAADHLATVLTVAIDACGSRLPRGAGTPMRESAARRQIERIAGTLVDAWFAAPKQTLPAWSFAVILQALGGEAAISWMPASARWNLDEAVLMVKNHLMRQPAEQQDKTLATLEGLIRQAAPPATATVAPAASAATTADGPATTAPGPSAGAAAPTSHKD